ncbi:MAG: hypothetical protein ACE5EQ_08990, partial [Phycisphaerae bacterium]
APWRIIPAYEFGFWPAPESGDSSWMRALRQAAFNLRIKLVYSRIGRFRATLAYLRSSQSTEESIRQTEQAHLTGGLLIARFLITYPYLVLKSLWQFVRAVFSFIPAGIYRYVRNVWSAFVNVWRQVGYPLKTFKLFRGLRNRSRQSGRIKAFERDTRHLFTALGPVNAGDLVFVPTLSEQDLIGLGCCLKRHPVAGMVSWHLLFRRNLFTGTEADYERQMQDGPVLQSREAFRRFQGDAAGIRTRFYTDTERLTDQYNRLGVIPFHTLPIPINPALSETLAVRRPGDPLRITYAGDARKEKGYHYLPGLVRTFWEECLERNEVVFEFQSNFLHASPTDATEELLAVSELESYPPEKVRLHRAPLGSDAYLQLVASADILIIPYDPHNYFARSSGIMVEALAAGIPMVVPSGSWMEQQIREASYEYCRQVAEENSALAHHRMSDICWNRRQGKNPTRNGVVTFRGKRNRASAFVAPSPGSTHMLVRFDRPIGPHRDVAVEMNQVCRTGRLRVHPRRAAQLNEAELYKYKDIDQSVRILSPPLSQEKCAALLELREEIDAVWLGLFNPDHDEDVSLRNLEILFLGGERGVLTEGVVGIAYDHPNTIGPQISKIVRNYAAYKRSAEQIAGWWRRRHSAKRLVEELLA